jgi:hypothetical protein
LIELASHALPFVMSGFSTRTSHAPGIMSDTPLCALKILRAVSLAESVQASHSMAEFGSAPQFDDVQCDTTLADPWEVWWRPMAPRSCSSRDHDVHKGAMEEDRPDPDRPNLLGLDENGLPNDATVIAQDALGAVEDESQG